MTALGVEIPDRGDFKAGFGDLAGVFLIGVGDLAADRGETVDLAGDRPGFFTEGFGEGDLVGVFLGGGGDLTGVRERALIGDFFGSDRGEGETDPFEPARLIFVGVLDLFRVTII